MLVYLPILSLRGIEGKMFRPMAWTVIFALGTALVLALVLMPVLASVFLSRKVGDRETLLIRWAKKGYRPLLEAAVARPIPVVLAAAAMFAASLWVAANLGAVFVPKLDEEALAIQAAVRFGTRGKGESHRAVRLTEDSQRVGP